MMKMDEHKELKKTFSDDGKLYRVVKLVSDLFELKFQFLPNANSLLKLFYSASSNNLVNRRQNKKCVFQIEKWQIVENERSPREIIVFRVSRVTQSQTFSLNFYQDLKVLKSVGPKNSIKKNLPSCFPCFLWKLSRNEFHVKKD